MSTFPSHNDRAPLAFRGDDTPVDPVDETLVAYLDGELDETERHRLEDQLIADAPLRQRLSELESGWQMLDHLPRPAITEDFARSTVEMVAAGASQALEIRRRRRPWQRIGRATLLVALVVAMAAAGYAAARWLQRTRFAAQLADLPLAANLPAYRLDTDLELMRQLADAEVWNEAMELAGDAGGLVVPETAPFPTSGDSLEADALEQLEPETRRELVVQWNHLQRMTPEELRAVRQKAEAVRDLEQPEVVLRTMKEYAWWWQELPWDARERIRDAPPDEKLAVILQEVEKSARGWVRDYGGMLEESDRDVIYEALKWIARQRLEWAEEHDVLSDEQLRNMANLRRHVLQDEVREYTVEEHLLLAMAVTSMRFARGGPHRESGESTSGEGRRGGSRNGDEEKSDPETTLFQRPTPAEMETVEDVLSNKALAILINFYSPEERHEILWRWCVGIILSKSPASDTAEALTRRYLTLPPEYREVLDLKDPAEILNRLAPRRRRGGRR